MKRLATFFTITSGAFATLPGIAVLSNNIGVPPNSSRVLFAATIEALGVLTLLLIWVNKDSIKKFSNTAITKLSIAGIITFTIALFCYLFFYGYFVVKVGQSESLFFPLWSQGELKTAIERFGSKEKLITEWGRDEVLELVKESSKTSLLVTTLIFLFIYQLIFVSLTFSFGLLAAKCMESGSAANKS